MISKAKSRPASAKSPPSAEQAEALALATNRLRAASVRITAARVKALAALIDARCAVSHQEIQDTLVGMDRVTLYRALDCLTDAGLAHKIAGDDRVFRYSAGTDHPHARQAPAAHQHGHFKCTRCARVYCLDQGNDAQLAAQALSTDLLQQLVQETLGQGFKGHDIELTIKGWCADCSHQRTHD
jgi:Fur family ferric uptake transcriptional regulator